ncbi:MAG: TIGR02117 family protein [Bacteroidetes bacterium]|nr:TIGR02117 family protein [Bacteroidota bacterium]
MKKIFKIIGYTLLTFIALILLYLGAAWGLSRITVMADRDTKPEVTIYLLTNGVHTDVVVPVKTEEKDWSRSILYKNTRSGDSVFDYLAFGWGDRGFYLEAQTMADLKAGTALRATFGLSSPAMHTTYYKVMKESKNCVRLAIAREQYQRLIGYIEKGLRLDSSGVATVVPTKIRYGQNDAFYESRGNYNLFHTCNTWANSALKACGQKACWWTPFDKGIFYQYK